MADFKSSVLILPGLGNSGEQHWQTQWERQFGFERVQQREWDTPVCFEWIDEVDQAVQRQGNKDVILVGHSLACCTIVSWAKRYGRKIKGALLVAPSDTEAPSYPEGTTGFMPMPLFELPFPSITVTSSDDFYVKFERAEAFAKAWGSTLVDIGPAGHINVASGHGAWHEGLVYLLKLDR
jgi:predicted alpha/beta hydrolase family esterase